MGTAPNSPFPASDAFMTFPPEQLHPIGSVTTTLRHIAQEVKHHQAKVPCGPCTACCRAGFVIELTPEEAARLPHVETPTGPQLAQRDDGSCVLLQDNRCTVYATRPRVCRGFDCRPFTMSGLLPQALARTPGFRVLTPTTPRQEDLVALLAFRLRALQVLAKLDLSGHPSVDELSCAVAVAVLSWRAGVPLGAGVITFLS